MWRVESGMMKDLWTLTKDLHTDDRNDADDLQTSRTSIISTTSKNNNGPFKNETFVTGGFKPY